MRSGAAPTDRLPIAGPAMPGLQWSSGPATQCALAVDNHTIQQLYT